MTIFRKGYEVVERIGNAHYVVKSTATDTSYLISKYRESENGVPLYNLDIDFVYCKNAYEGYYETVIGNHNNGVPFRMQDGVREYDGVKSNFKAIVKELYARDELIKQRKEQK